MDQPSLKKIRPFFLCVVICLVTVFPHSFMIEVYNNITPYVETFINDSLKSTDITTQCCGHENAELAITYSSIVAAVMIGDLVASPFVGYLSDFFGRKFILLALAGGIRVFGCVILMIAQPVNMFQLLAIGQVILGFSTAITGTIGLVYLLEFAPPQWDGFVISLYALFGTLGNFTSQFFGFSWILGTTTRWPLMFLIPLATGIVAIGIQFWFPESPYFLLEVKKDRDGARRSYSKIYKNEDDDVIDLLLTHASLTSQNKNRTYEVSYRQMFSHQPYFRACMTTLALRGLIVALGFLGFQVYSTVIYHGFAVSLSTAQTATVVGVLAQVFTRLAAFFMLAKFPNKANFIAMFGLCVLFYIGLCIAPHFTAESSLASVISIVCMILLGGVFKILFSLVQGLPVQLNPTEIRARSVSLGRVFCNVGVLLTRLTFLPLYAKIHSWVFIIFTLVPIPIAVYLCLEMPETQGKTQSEIAEYWTEPNLCFKKGDDGLDEAITKESSNGYGSLVNSTRI